MYIILIQKTLKLSCAAHGERLNMMEILRLALGSNIIEGYLSKLKSLDYIIWRDGWDARANIIPRSSYFSTIAGCRKSDTLRWPGRTG